MTSLTEPATQQQIEFLEQHGHNVSGPLTRGEAAEMIRRIREYRPTANTDLGGLSQLQGSAAYKLGLAFELSGFCAGRHLHSSSPVYANRQDFWLDSCREVTQMHHASSQVMELYKLCGCRFSMPTAQEVQEVLDALDNAVPEWETAHPELFYSTLELNFPELLKKT